MTRNFVPSNIPFRLYEKPDDTSVRNRADVTQTGVLAFCQRSNDQRVKSRVNSLNGDTIYDRMISLASCMQYSREVNAGRDDHVDMSTPISSAVAACQIYPESNRSRTTGGLWLGLVLFRTFRKGLGFSALRSCHLVVL